MGNDLQGKSYYNEIGAYAQSKASKLTTLATGFLFKNESQGGERVLYTALSTEVENLNGNYFANCRVTRPVALARNRDNQQKLWQVSCQLLDITNFGAKWCELKC